MLEHQTLNMQEKKDTEVLYSENRAMFVEGNGGSGDQLLYHSVLSKYIEGLPFIINEVVTDHSTGYFLRSFNQPIRALYQIAYDHRRGQYSIPDSRTFLELNDSNSLVSILRGKTQFGNLYCYELKAAPAGELRLKEMMRADLKRYFGYDARLEKRVITCLVFRSKDTSRIHTKGGKPQSDDEVSPYMLKVTNISFSRLLHRLEGAKCIASGRYPIVDETHVRGNVDINLPVINLSDWKALAEGLKPYGVILQLENRETEVLVIRDAK